MSRPGARGRAPEMRVKSPAENRSCKLGWIPAPLRGIAADPRYRRNGAGYAMDLSDFCNRHGSSRHIGAQNVGRVHPSCSFPCCGRRIWPVLLSSGAGATTYSGGSRLCCLVGNGCRLHHIDRKVLFRAEVGNSGTRGDCTDHCRGDHGSGLFRNRHSLAGAE